MPLSEDLQRSVFQSVAQMQDFLITNAKNDAAVCTAVARARGIVAKQFSIPVGEVKDIESNGLTGKWPPLEP